MVNITLNNITCYSYNYGEIGYVIGRSYGNVSINNMSCLSITCTSYGVYLGAIGTNSKGSPNFTQIYNADFSVSVSSSNSVASIILTY
jgi:D-alanyl-lipoteichoic acid acyltransferase DltB (MBOAT superfamily)